MNARQFAMLDLVASRLRAMGHPRRLVIIAALKSGRRSVGELAEIVSIPLVSVSQHLKALERAGLIVAERQGRQIYYEIQAPLVNEICMAVCRQAELDCEHSAQQRAEFEELRSALLRN